VGILIFPTRLSLLLKEAFTSGLEVFSHSALG